MKALLNVPQMPHSIQTVLVIIGGCYAVYFALRVVATAVHVVLISRETGEPICEVLAPVRKVLGYPFRRIAQAVRTRLTKFDVYTEEWWKESMLTTSDRLPKFLLNQ